MSPATAHSNSTTHSQRGEGIEAKKPSLLLALWRTVIILGTPQAAFTALNTYLSVSRVLSGPLRPLPAAPAALLGPVTTDISGSWPVLKKKSL